MILIQISRGNLVQSSHKYTVFIIMPWGFEESKLWLVISAYSSSIDFFTGDGSEVNTAFQSLRGQKEKLQDPPIERDLHLALEDLYYGCTKKIKISRRVSSAHRGTDKIIWTHEKLKQRDMFDTGHEWRRTHIQHQGQNFNLHCKSRMERRDTDHVSKRGRPGMTKHIFITISFCHDCKLILVITE